MEPTSSPAYTEKMCWDEVVMEQPNFSENVRTYQENDMNDPYIQYSYTKYGVLTWRWY